MGARVPFRTLQLTAITWRKVLAAGFPINGASNHKGAVAELTERLGGPLGSRSTMRARLSMAQALGIDVPQCPGIVDEEQAAARRRQYVDDKDYQRWLDGLPPPTDRTASPPERSEAGRAKTGPRVSPAPEGATRPALTDLASKIVPLLRGGPKTAEEIGRILNLEEYLVAHAVAEAHRRGAAVIERDGRFHLDAAPALGSSKSTSRELVTDANGVLTFAACGDMHLGSKYERLDCLNDYYDQVEKRGITRVLNTGNWIDGEASFNVHDIHVHGLDNQMRYLADNYPKRSGVETWAVTGADHEGWYAKREGIDVGRYAENAMRHAGRDDWHDMGFMEAFIPIVHGGTGKRCQLCLMHPGGGSAYALSYAPQKIVEGFDGGDKPALLLLGHYHKSGYNLIRNVHTGQTGTFQDQTPFMRQRKLAAHVGGTFWRVELDAETGAAIECAYTFRSYFNKDYYNGRWSMHGPVNHAVRAA